MWIRSQDRKKLVKLKNLKINHYMIVNGDKSKECYITIDGEGGIGDYSSEEKALKVLDMIQEKILCPQYINDIGGNEMAIYKNKVFQMPQDNEV